jgi:2-iminobutanoate/2-iminopropanoate deaminase
VTASPIQPILSSKAAAPLGPYSQAVKVSCASTQLIFVSGQLGLHPTTRQLGATIQEQTEWTFQNISALLQEARSSWNQVVRVEIYLSDIKNMPEVNELYERQLKGVTTLPARQTMQVAALPKEALIEISCIAISE